MSFYFYIILCDKNCHPSFQKMTLHIFYKAEIKKHFLHYNNKKLDFCHKIVTVIIIVTVY